MKIWKGSWDLVARALEANSVLHSLLYRYSKKKKKFPARARARNFITSFKKVHRGQMQECVLFVKEMVSRFEVHKTKIDLYVLDKLQSF